MDPASGFVGVPDEAGVPPFCGKCHAGVLENYLKSAHGALAGKGGPNCVNCHTAHEQQKASLALINEKLCGSCHAFERAERIKRAMEATEKELEQTDRQAEALWARGFDVDSIRKRIFADRNAFHRQTHVILVDQIVRAATEIRSELGKVEADIGKYQRIAAWREKVGAGVVLLFLVAALSFYYLKKDLVKEYLEKKYGRS
jgi:hypothetical protein